MKIIRFPVQARVRFAAGNPGMELALNLVWVVLAIMSLLLRGIHALWQHRQSRNFIGIIALVCVLAFLFPVISLSDDLHSPALCETGKLKKWVSSNPAEALESSAPGQMALPEPPARLAAAPHNEACLPSRELVWFNLDRRPPPERS